MFSMLGQTGKASVTSCDTEKVDYRRGGLSSQRQSLITDPLHRRPLSIARHHPLHVAGSGSGIIRQVEK